MMKTKFFALLLSVASVLGGLTSCNSGGSSDYITQQVLTNFINVTTELSSGQQNLSANVGYKIELNLTQGLATISMEGFRLPNGTNYGTLIFANMPFSYNSNGWIEINQSVVVPTTSAGLQAPAFSSFRFAILDRVLPSDIYYPLFNISYSVDGYNIVSIPPSVINQGTTVVSTEGQPNYTSSDEDSATLYAVSIDTNTMMGNISIQGAKFAAAMPALNMSFQNIPFTVDASGKISLRIDSLEPVLITGSNSTTPMPNYPITNLSCVTDDQNNMSLQFTCTIKSDRNGVATETAYNVSVTSSTPTFKN